MLKFRWTATPRGLSTMSTTVTPVIHGTFARDATWWRLGSDRQTSFADQLERELSERGLAGTVWRPALVGDFNYSSFSWPDGNRHSDRVAGAHSLSFSLNELAKQVQSNPERAANREFRRSL